MNSANIAHATEQRNRTGICNKVSYHVGNDKVVRNLYALVLDKNEVGSFGDSIRKPNGIQSFHEDFSALFIGRELFLEELLLLGLFEANGYCLLEGRVGTYGEV